MPRRARRTVEERIGLFGGTFDPPHLGHLAIAEWAREQLGLDRVLFVPAGVPPHKVDRSRTPVVHRLAMTRLATRDNPAFDVSTLETRADGPSYTVVTLATLVRRFPDASWYLILGADSLREFATWRRPEDIAAMATIVVAGRPESPEPRARRSRPAWDRSVVWLDNPGFAISSTALRHRARAGGSLRYLVPDPVARYVARHGLYRKER